MYDNRRIYKFFGKQREDFKVQDARTQARLEAMEFSDVVSVDVVSPADQPEDDTFLKVAKAQAIIMQGIDAKPLQVCLAEKDNPFRMCARLQERYATSNISGQVQLQTRLKSLPYTGEPMSYFIGSFQETFNRLEFMNALFPEQMQVAMLLAAFGEKTDSSYGHIIAAMQNARQELSWENVTARLLQKFDEKKWNNELNASFGSQITNHTLFVLRPYAKTFFAFKAVCRAMLQMCRKRTFDEEISL